MSTVKSLSVGDGDMFYIDHNNDSFSVIDCCLSDDNSGRILKEIKALLQAKHIVRFISTHPDDDHIRGLKALDGELDIRNFYCVANEASKDEETEDFTRYCELRDSDSKAFYLVKGCRRCWLNSDDEKDERKGSGINVYWPETEDEDYKEALQVAKDGGKANNISAVVTYGIRDGVTFMWMGDLETEFMDTIKDNLNVPKAEILFAPHHGRDTGKVPEEILNKITPDIIVIGEAPSEHLNYYAGYNTITQNSAGDITFECEGKKLHIYVSEEDYAVDFLDDEGKASSEGKNYLGTLNV